MKYQRRLPLFPSEMIMFNPVSGVHQKDDIVYYYHNGLQLFHHHISDKKSYRYITANMVVNGICSVTEISKVLNVTVRSLQIYAKTLRDNGSQYFFKINKIRLKSYKYNEAIFDEAQQLLDAGLNVYVISKLMNIPGSTLRFHVKSGNLKKRNS